MEAELADRKMREYILKKKNQRERARLLREYRTENKQYPANQYQKYRKNKQDICVSRAMYNNSNDMNMNKVLSMMEQIKGQINMLKSEINDLKLENKDLKCNMQQLQNRQYGDRQNHTASNHVNHPNTSMSLIETLPFSMNGVQRNSNNSSRKTSRSDHQNMSMGRLKINMSKSLKNLKLKRKQVPNNINYHKDNYSKSNQRNHGKESYRSQSYSASVNEEKTMSQSRGPHSSSAMDLIHKLSELENVNLKIERVECRQCGRKFIQSALERHAKICKKVFCKKRKVFDTKDKRLDNDAKNAQNSSCDEYKLRKIRKKKKESWKAKSSMLRNAVRASKGGHVKSGMPLSEIPYQSTYDDRVECPHCGRRFAEQTAERHIPRCRDIISKPKTLRRKR